MWEREQDNMHTCRMWLTLFRLCFSLCLERFCVAPDYITLLFFCSWINIFYKFQGRSLRIVTLCLSLLRQPEGQNERNTWRRPGVICTTGFGLRLLMTSDSIQLLHPILDDLTGCFCWAGPLCCQSDGCLSGVLASMMWLKHGCKAVRSNTAEGGSAEPPRVR